MQSFFRDYLGGVGGKQVGPNSFPLPQPAWVGALHFSRRLLHKLSPEAKILSLKALENHGHDPNTTSDFPGLPVPTSTVHPPLVWSPAATWWGGTALRAECALRSSLSVQCAAGKKAGTALGFIPLPRWGIKMINAAGKVLEIRKWWAPWKNKAWNGGHACTVLNREEGKPREKTTTAWRPAGDGGMTRVRIWEKRVPRPRKSQSRVISTSGMDGDEKGETPSPR